MRRRALLATLPIAALGACATATPPAQSPLRFVFFEDDSAALGEAARAVVTGAARDALANPSAPVRVLGYVAPEPGETPIVALSRARAEVVANELARAGVPRERIRVEGRGAAEPGDQQVARRRVEIRIGA